MQDQQIYKTIMLVTNLNAPAIKIIKYFSLIIINNSNVRETDVQKTKVGLQFWMPVVP